METKIQERRRKMTEIQRVKAVTESELRSAEETLTQIQQQCAQLGYATPEAAEQALTQQLDAIAKEIERYSALLA